jgi:hypothetical protein
MEAAEALYIVHLCGEKADTRAYPMLCKMIAEDPSIERWLDDAVTETLPGILIKGFDGNHELLRKAVESQRGDEFARASALAALGYLVRAKNAMSDAEMRVYLRRLRREAGPQGESVIWMTWAATAANLGYKDFRAEVLQLNRTNFVPAHDFGSDEFDRRIALANADKSGLAGFEDDFVAPLGDALSALESLAGARSLTSCFRLPTGLSRVGACGP